MGGGGGGRTESLYRSTRIVHGVLNGKVGRFFCIEIQHVACDKVITD